MPSNAEVGFDPNWDEEKRLAWYRKRLEEMNDKIESSKPPNLPDNPLDDSPVDISDHPFHKVMKYLREHRIPIYVTEKGDILVYLEGDQDLPKDVIDLLLVAQICLQLEE